MLEISQILLNEIVEHAKLTYPNECCGVIIGSFDGENKLAKKIFKSKNLNNERSKDRYELDPQDFIKADKESESLGLEIIGIYHSHPDHPSIPSETDRENAYDFYSYLIISIYNGEFFSKNSWTLDNLYHFREELIVDN